VIASIKGTVVESVDGAVLVEVNGIGYQINITPKLQKTLRAGDQANLRTRLVVREDSLTLFGFADSSEANLFDLLCSVNGVGPKSALSILSAMNPQEIYQAVNLEDDSAFQSVSGVGAKTAKLIVLSLAGKIPVLATGSPKRDSNVLDALIALGWPEKSARSALSEIELTEVDEQTALRQALAVLGAKKGVRD
jgi:holliday junction DNA helicase RuvA